MIVSILPVLSISSPFNHTFSFLIFYYFSFSSPPPCALFSYFSALTGSGFACHVTLVTDCVMDDILVRALLCLRYTAGQNHPATSHSTCHTPHPAHVTLYYLDFPLLLLLFKATLHYLSFHCSVSVTVYHCLKHCTITFFLFLSFCVLPLFERKVISCNNTVSSSKPIICVMFSHRLFAFYFYS